MITSIQRLVLVSVLALLTSGCAVRFVYNQPNHNCAYNNADAIAPFYLSDPQARMGIFDQFVAKCISRPG